MWCNKCHWGSEIHTPFKLEGGDYVCNNCGKSGKLGGKDAQFVDKNPVPNDPKSSIHPSRQTKNVRRNKSETESEVAATD